MKQLNSYDLSRNFWDWAFENPDLIRPQHSAIYFFAIEHCNRLGWKDKFGFPSQMTMDAIGICKYRTYIKYFNELVEWGFFISVQKSKNQYSANVISLQSAIPKKGKALDKAFIKRGVKQREKQLQSEGKSNQHSDGSIDKQINKEQINKEQRTNNSETFNLLKQIFTDSYFSLTENEYYFIAVDGAKIKSIEKKLLHAYKNKGNNNPSKDEMKNGFEHILKLAKSDKWIKENYSLSIIDSKFNEIISKKNEQQTNYDKLKSGYAAIDKEFGN